MVYKKRERRTQKPLSRCPGNVLLASDQYGLTIALGTAGREQKHIPVLSMQAISGSCDNKIQLAVN